MAELKELQLRLRAQTARLRAQYLVPAPISSTAWLRAAPPEPKRTAQLVVLAPAVLLRVSLVRPAQPRLLWVLAAGLFHRPRASTWSSLENPSRTSPPNLA